MLKSELLMLSLYVSSCVFCMFLIDDPMVQYSVHINKLYTYSRYLECMLQLCHQPVFKINLTKSVYNITH